MSSGNGSVRGTPDASPRGEGPSSLDGGEQQTRAEKVRTLGDQRKRNAKMKHKSRYEHLRTIDLVSLQIQTPLIAYPNAPIVGYVEAIILPSLVEGIAIYLIGHVHIDQRPREGKIDVVDHILVKDKKHIFQQPKGSEKNLRPLIMGNSSTTRTPSKTISEFSDIYLAGGIERGKISNMDIGGKLSDMSDEEDDHDDINEPMEESKFVRVRSFGGRDIDEVGYDVKRQVQEHTKHEEMESIYRRGKEFRNELLSAEKKKIGFEWRWPKFTQPGCNSFHYPSATNLYSNGLEPPQIYDHNTGKIVYKLIVVAEISGVKWKIEHDANVRLKSDDAVFFACYPRIKHIKQEYLLAKGGMMTPNNSKLMKKNSMIVNKQQREGEPKAGSSAQSNASSNAGRVRNPRRVATGEIQITIGKSKCGCLPKEVRDKWFPPPKQGVGCVTVVENVSVPIVAGTSAVNEIIKPGITGLSGGDKDDNGEKSDFNPTASMMMSTGDRNFVINPWVAVGDGGNEILVFYKGEVSTGCVDPRFGFARAPTTFGNIAAWHNNNRLNNIAAWHNNSSRASYTDLHGSQSSRSNSSGTRAVPKSNAVRVVDVSDDLANSRGTPGGRISASSNTPAATFAQKMAMIKNEITLVSVLKKESQFESNSSPAKGPGPAITGALATGAAGTIQGFSIGREPSGLQDAINGLKDLSLSTLTSFNTGEGRYSQQELDELNFIEDINTDCIYDRSPKYPFATRIDGGILPSRKARSHVHVLTVKVKNESSKRQKIGSIKAFIGECETSFGMQHRMSKPFKRHVIYSDSNPSAVAGGVVGAAANGNSACGSNRDGSNSEPGSEPVVPTGKFLEPGQEEELLLKIPSYLPVYDAKDNLNYRGSTSFYGLGKSGERKGPRRRGKINFSIQHYFQMEVEVTGGETGTAEGGKARIGLSDQIPCLVLKPAIDRELNILTLTEAEKLIERDSMFNGTNFRVFIVDSKKKYTEPRLLANENAPFGDASLGLNHMEPGPDEFLAYITRARADSIHSQGGGRKSANLERSEDRIGGKAAHGSNERDRAERDRSERSGANARHDSKDSQETSVDESDIHLRDRANVRRGLDRDDRYLDAQERNGRGYNQDRSDRSDDDIRRYDRDRYDRDLSDDDMRRVDSYGSRSDMRRKDSYDSRPDTRRSDSHDSKPGDDIRRKNSYDRGFRHHVQSRLHSRGLDSQDSSEAPHVPSRMVSRGVESRGESHDSVATRDDDGGQFSDNRHYRNDARDYEDGRFPSGDPSHDDRGGYRKDDRNGLAVGYRDGRDKDLLDDDSILNATTNDGPQNVVKSQISMTATLEAKYGAQRPSGPKPLAGPKGLADKMKRSSQTTIPPTDHLAEAHGGSKKSFMEGKNRSPSQSPRSASLGEPRRRSGEQRRPSANRGTSAPHSPRM